MSCPALTLALLACLALLPATLLAQDRQRGEGKERSDAAKPARDRQRGEGKERSDAEKPARPGRGPGENADAAGGDPVHQKALAHYARGEYARAAAAFKAAYLAAPKPELLYAIGQALRLAGDCSEALEYYRQYLRTRPGPKQVVSTRENMKRCERATSTSRPATASAPTTLPVVARRAEPVAPPPRPAWYRDWPGWTLLGTGLVAGGAGAGVFLVGRGQVADANGAADYGAFDRGYSSGRSGELQQRVGVAAMAAGAALITAGVVRWLLVRRSRLRAAR
jgi:tetratricopeptide (TPR) repeat protein